MIDNVIIVILSVVVQVVVICYCFLLCVIYYVLESCSLFDVMLGFVFKDVFCDLDEKNIKLQMLEFGWGLCVVFCEICFCYYLRVLYFFWSMRS